MQCISAFVFLATPLADHMPSKPLPNHPSISSPCCHSLTECLFQVCLLQCSQRGWAQGPSQEEAGCEVGRSTPPPDTRLPPVCRCLSNTQTRDIPSLSGIPQRTRPWAVPKPTTGQPACYILCIILKAVNEERNSNTALH